MTMPIGSQRPVTTESIFTKPTINNFQSDVATRSSLISLSQPCEKGFFDSVTNFVKKVFSVIFSPFTYVYGLLTGSKTDEAGNAAAKENVELSDAANEFIALFAEPEEDADAEDLK